MIRVIILGCTGSIGSTALKAIRENLAPLQVVGLCAHSHAESLASLAKEFGAEAVCLTNGAHYECTNARTYRGFSGLQQMLKELDADIVLNAIAGFEGLKASLISLGQGFDLALANKESVVCAGSFLFEVARANNRRIIPVDSEHSAILELLKGRSRESVDSLILTASGGPFRTMEKERFSSITTEQALAHPTWKMGRKISIDSATLANKALEVIEAAHLFGFDGDHIEVVIHPQSILHSMIRTTDGAVYAQLGNPDMTLPIINALTEGSRNLVKRLDFTKLSLHFEAPDYQRFPLLDLAFSILKRKGATALAFNAADEVAVGAFLDGSISYLRLIEVVQRTVEENWDEKIHDFDQILALDAKARDIARRHL